jgi:cation diffusion facilitator family transporter
MNTHTHDLSPWQHSHVFDSGNRRGEARTRVVLVVTLIMMVAEIIGGWLTGSMSLLADGWHMGTHALALGVATVAYALARRHARDSRYAFGTWKIEVLGGFASALVLAMVAAGIAFESALRLWHGTAIDAAAALWVACVGLAVNLVSAWLLHGADDAAHDHGPAASGRHGDAHDHADDKGHHHGHVHAAHSHVEHPIATADGGHDLNLRAAYVHVLADALTSVLAILALAATLWLGWKWLDPLVGVLGAAVIGVWSVGLLRQTAAVLLDREMDHPLVEQIRTAIESDGDARVADLHLWRVGRQQYAAIASIVADAPLPSADYRARLISFPALAHLSLEVNQCPHADQAAQAFSASH